MKIKFSKVMIQLISFGFLLLFSKAFGGALTYDNKTSYKIYFKEVPLVVLGTVDSIIQRITTTPVNPGETGGSKDMTGWAQLRAVGNYQTDFKLPYKMVIEKEDQKPQEFSLDLTNDKTSLTLENGCNLNVNAVRSGEGEKTIFLKRGIEIKLKFYDNVEIKITEDCSQKS